MLTGLRSHLRYNLKSLTTLQHARPVLTASSKGLSLPVPMGRKRKLEPGGEQKLGFFCPACGQLALKWPVFSRHMQRCCPDLTRGTKLLCDDKADHQASEQPTLILEALKLAIEGEEALRQECVSAGPGLPELVSHCWLYMLVRQSFAAITCLSLPSKVTLLILVSQMHLTFRGVDESGEPIRRDAGEVAALMGLPKKRIELMLHRALRAIPLVADKDPITVVPTSPRALQSFVPPCPFLLALTIVLAGPEQVHL